MYCNSEVWDTQWSLLAHTHAGMPCNFNHYMHTWFARKYPEAVSHCGHIYICRLAANLRITLYNTKMVYGSVKNSQQAFNNSSASLVLVFFRLFAFYVQQSQQAFNNSNLVLCLLLWRTFSTERNILLDYHPGDIWILFLNLQRDNARHIRLI